MKEGRLTGGAGERSPSMKGTGSRGHSRPQARVDASQAYPRTVSAWLAATLAAAVLLGTGWGHRVLIARIDHALQQIVQPVQPLASLPLQLGGWLGRDEPLDERVRQAAHFDDQYVNRVYFNPRVGASVGVFIGFVGRPRSRLGHRPDVCYAAHGWEQEWQKSVPVTTPAGSSVPSILHKFRPPDAFGRPKLVLATYMVNGRFVYDPAAFRQYNARSPNLLGGRPAYLTRIHVSLVASGNQAADTAVLKEFVALVAEPTANMMPYWEK